MLRRNGKIILGVLGASAVIGVGAAAADPPSWAGGSAPQVTRVATKTTTQTRDRIQLRARDGTGPRHDQARLHQRMQDQTRLHQQLRDGTGPTCPYRS